LQIKTLLLERYYLIKEEIDSGEEVSRINTKSTVERYYLIKEEIDSGEEVWISRTCGETDGGAKSCLASLAFILR
jgi:hypothetical protein